MGGRRSEARGDAAAAAAVHLAVAPAASSSNSRSAAAALSFVIALLAPRGPQPPRARRRELVPPGLSGGPRWSHLARFTMAEGDRNKYGLPASWELSAAAELQHSRLLALPLFSHAASIISEALITALHPWNTVSLIKQGITHQASHANPIASRKRQRTPSRCRCRPH